MGGKMRARGSRGFTLIEVLVAALVLAIGIFGAAGAQLAALRTRQGSAQLSAGVRLAADLAERMRANVAQTQASGAVNPYLALRYDAATDGAPQPPALCYAGAACDSAELAGFDLYELKLALHDGFPGGRVLVCRDNDPWDASARALTWACSGAPGAPIVVKIGWRVKAARGGATPAAAQAAPAPAPLVALSVAGGSPGALSGAMPGARPGGMP